MSMQERRKHPRKKVTYPIPVIDSDREHLLGQLANISLEGFMLLSPDTLDVNRIFQVRMDLPEACGGQVVCLGAECLWQESSSDPRQYWTGFQIIDISPENRGHIQRLLDEHL